MAKKGKLIVIDGIDGSGKSTQIKLLIEHLKKDGQKVKLIDFPEYYSNFFGKFIGHCLSEQYYNWTHIHPKIASIVYAADRFESKDKIIKWIKAGNIVIADRYETTNQIHQGGKISNVKKRQAFIKWLEEMEYGVFKIPRPDKVFYLSLPLNIVFKLIKERNKNSQRNYLGRKKEDLVEKDIEYMTNSRKSAIWLAKTQKGWVKIDCTKDGSIDTRENIHQKIYEQVKKIV